jgi:PAS domain S-box-containing protein
MALLAFVVAAMYAVIAFSIVPKLARAALGGPRLLQVARWGASAFFAGCALTHLDIGLTALAAARVGPMAGSMPPMTGSGRPLLTLVTQVLPHIAQIIGGGLFIGIARNRLEWSVAAREIAEELRARETQFRATFEKNPVGQVLIGVHGPQEGTILQINPALRAMVRAGDDDLTGRPYRDLLGPGDRAWATGDLARLIAGEPVDRRERPLTGPDGQRTWVSVESSMVRDERGQALFALVRVRDIAGQRRTETLRTVQHLVSQETAGAVPVGTGVRAVLRVLVQTLDWAGGEYWQADPGRATISRVTSWWSPALASSSLASSGPPDYPRGEGLPGTAWLSGSRTWVGDLAGWPDTGVVQAARTAGVRSALALPVLSGDQAGVLLLFATRMAEPDDELTSALDAVCAHVGRFVVRRRAEEFRHLLESTPDALVIADADGRIVLVNTQTEQLFGFEREELLGEPVEKLMPERFRTLHPRRRARYHRNPGVRSVGIGTEVRGQRKDGSQFPVEISLRPLKTEGATLVASSIRDLTARRESEELRFRLAAIVESSDDAIFGSSLDGRITSWNRAAEKIFGYPEREAIGRPLWMLLPGGQESEVAEVLARLRAGAREEHHDAVRRHRDGHAVHVSSRMSPIRDEYGTLVGASCVIRDITGRKLADAALAQAKDAAETSRDAFESFSYSVAHDLRAPLRAIDGFSQVLAEEYAPVLDTTGLEYLGRLSAAAQKMGKLIDSLLGLARVTHRDIASRAVDLSALATATAERLRQEEPERRIRMIVEPGLTAVGDPILLANVLDNLLENAWKFTRHRPETEIEFGWAAPEYFVRDNGAGFDMAFADKLFGVFQRLHTAQEFDGIGIGLATVQRIVRRHGGQIRAQGTPGQGATFYFTLGGPTARPTPPIPAQLTSLTPLSP